MVQELVSLVKRSAQEASLWAYAAWTLPFTALAAIVFEHYIGNDNMIHFTIIAITVTFFSISVFWWWWALNKLVVLLKYTHENDTRFDEMLHEIKAARALIKEEIDSNVGNR